MIVRVEGVSLSDIADITGGLTLREILALANRIADQIEMTGEQRRRQETVFTCSWFLPVSTKSHEPYRIVFHPDLWFRVNIKDFETVLLEELQHASDYAKGMKVSSAVGTGSASYYTGDLFEFRAIVQMARLRPIERVRVLFHNAVWEIVRVLDPDNLWWCLTMRPEHLRQAVKNAMLPRYLVQMLAQALRARGYIIAAAAILKEEE